MDRPTREQILQESAGPRLDAWVAEFVMGWHRGEAGLPPLPRGEVWTARGWVDDSGQLQATTFPASTDIAAAWRVVERFRAHEVSGGSRTGLWRWYLESPPESEKLYGEAEAEAPMLAICRAALLAVLTARA